MTSLDRILPIVLDEEQSLAGELLARGKSVFVTGPAGTGKSVVLRSLRERFPLAVTATTGLAAMAVGGSTYHSWSGIGYGGEPDAILKRMSEYVKTRIRSTHFLAIDEVSMMSSMEVDMLSYILSQVRCDSRPFGGITIAFFGDFMQLPPVDESGLTFESEAWAALNPTVVNLTKVYRQSDPAFQRMLGQLRFAALDADSLSLLASRMNARDEEPEKPPVKLYSTNRDVEAENLLALDRIDAPETVFPADDWASHEMHQKDLDKFCRWPKDLVVKPGARVMLLSNINVEGGLANGSMGTVQLIEEGTKRIHVLFDNGCVEAVSPGAFEKKAMELRRGLWEESVVARRTQFPLRLAYAITTHKSQGMSLDKVAVHLRDCFAPGQAYVALSRARTLGGLFINNYADKCIRHDRRAAEFYRQHGAYVA